MYQLMLAVPQLNSSSIGRRKEIPLSGFPKDFVYEGIKFIPYSYKRKVPKQFGLRRKTAVKSLVAALMEADAEVYHFHEDEVCIKAAAELKRKRPEKKIIFDFHEMYLFQYREDPSKTHRLPEYIDFENKIISTADAVITVSPFISDYFKTLGADNVFTVMNSQSDKILGTSGGESKEKKEAPFTVVHEGSMKFDRGLKLFLETVLLSRPEIRFKIIGDIPPAESEYLKSHKNYNELKNRVEVTGFLPYKEMSLHLKTASIGIDFRTSMNAQSGIANKFFDYLAFGLPVIGLKNLSSDRFFDKYGFGYSIQEASPQKAAEKINTLYNDPEKMKEMSEASRLAFTEELNWENQFEKLLSAYQSL